MRTVVTLELNELNLELAERYTVDLDLPHFRRLLTTTRRWDTEAEPVYEHLEPWIQWVTAHTGLSYAEHGVFRLGDTGDPPAEQIWETVAHRFGAKIGAISPMNGQNRAPSPAFFVPDPWSDVAVTGPLDLRLLHAGAKEAVGENAHGGPSLPGYLKLAAAAAVNADKRRLTRYARLIGRSRSRSWLRAVLLDYLLVDTFVRHWQATRPDYATLFLNGGAHIQHHYMFNSRFYQGPHSNPEWYIAADEDPLAELYQHYDRLLGTLFALTDRTDTRLLVCTGLGQVANADLVFYYRPVDHARLMEQLGLIGVTGIRALMSRDFAVEFVSVDAAAGGQRVLEEVRAVDGRPFFRVDNRGTDLFVAVAYTAELAKSASATTAAGEIPGFGALFSHVSIENAVHESLGGFFDCGSEPLPDRPRIPLADVFDYVVDSVGNAA